MKKEKTWISTIRFIGEILSFAYAFYSALADIITLPTIGNRQWGLVIAIALFCVLTWWHIYDLQSQINIFKNVRPRIFIKEPKVVSSQAYLLTNEYKKLVVTGQGPISRAAVEAYGQPYNVDYVCIYLVNNPIIRDENSYARGMVAKVTFLNSDSKKYGQEYFGRWGDIQSPHTLTVEQSIRDLLKADIESSGLPKRLNIAVKRQDDDTVYGFGFFDQEDTGFTNPKLKFDRSKYIVSIKFSGDNVEEFEGKFILKNTKGNLSITVAEPTTISKRFRLGKRRQKSRRK